MRLPWWWGKRGWEAYIRSRIKPCGNINKTGYDILVSIDEDGKMKSELPSYVFSTEFCKALKLTGWPILLSKYTRPMSPLYRSLVYGGFCVNVLTRDAFNDPWAWMKATVEYAEILVKEVMSSPLPVKENEKIKDKDKEEEDLCEATKIWLYIDENGDIIKSILPKWVISTDLIEELRSGIPILTNNPGTKLFYMGYSIGPIIEHWSSDTASRYILILGRVRTLIKKAKREVTS